MSEVEAVLEHLELAGRLNDRARSVLAASAVLKRYRPRQTLWLAGTRPGGLHVIIEGEVRIVRGGERQHVIHIAGPGETLGEVPLFDGGTYPATAIAHAKTVCLFIDRDAIFTILREDPDFARELLSRLSGRIRYLVDQLHRATVWTVRTRLASWLADRLPADARGGVRIALRVSQSELAEQLGTVREVLARELATLRRHGIVRSASRGTLEVLDPESLRLLAGGLDVLQRPRL